MTARVVLNPRRAKPFFGRHPWVYAGAIARVEGEPADGDEVDVVSHAGNFIARGLFNGQSKIRVRLYTWEPEIPIDRAFLKSRLEEAIRLRYDILKLGGEGKACRLVFSESDGLSGLTVDRYADWLTVQITSLGMARRRDVIAELLAELLQPKGIYLRTEKGIRQLEGLELQDGPLLGGIPTEPIVIEDDGLRFLVNPAEGQKTGFYIDQRDNRRAVARLASGRRMLDAFCYSGGFGLCASRAGAASVLGIDLSEPALDLARRNAELNGLTNLEFRRGDVFDHLDALVSAGEKFGVVVLDPPRFARSRGAVDEAMRGYRRLQTLALRLLEPDGILATCCCSGVIEPGMLVELLSQLAADERRAIRILERRGQSADHPVSASCPETSYLKCFICCVR